MGASQSCTVGAPLDAAELTALAKPKLSAPSPSSYEVLRAAARRMVTPGAMTDAQLASAVAALPAGLPIAFVADVARVPIHGDPSAPVTVAAVKAMQVKLAPRPPPAPKTEAHKTAAPPKDKIAATSMG